MMSTNCFTFFPLRWNNPCVGFYDSGKTSNHAMAQLIAVSSSYKPPISLSFGFAFYFCRHYWIRYVSVRLSSWKKGNCICDLYRIILSIANQVNVPCLASSMMWLFLSMPFLSPTHEIICKRLTPSIATRLKRCESRWLQIFHAWLSL